jgi:hypothetical protein
MRYQVYEYMVITSVVVEREVDSQGNTSQGNVKGYRANNISRGRMGLGFCQDEDLNTAWTITLNYLW